MILTRRSYGSGASMRRSPMARFWRRWRFRRSRTSSRLRGVWGKTRSDMAVEIVMPRVDMDMTSGRMGRWHAPEGAHVEKGATLFEIETDKAAMEVDAPASGGLKFVAASEGDVLPVGACIGWIVPEGESFAPPPEKADALPIARPETSVLPNALWRGGGGGGGAKLAAVDRH